MQRVEARVLIVDDDLLSCIALHQALHTLGCRFIDEARDGVTALRLLAYAHYDLVISSWKMKLMTGAELLRVIRGRAALESLPVIIATAVTPSVVAQAAELGVSAFLPRPFSLATLDELLRIFVGPVASSAPGVEAGSEAH